MKQLLLLIFVLSLAACTDNKRKWSRDYVIEKCKTKFKNTPELTGKVTPDDMSRICECNADKMMQQYHNEEEANADQAGVGKIATDCTFEVLTGK